MTPVTRLKADRDYAQIYKYNLHRGEKELQ